MILQAPEFLKKRVFLTFFVLSLVNDDSFLQNEVESGNVFGLQEKKSKKKNC
jgi:hypothetical protein